MSFKIGLIGKPNAGKSTLFSAITATEVEIANYPFTTVTPNIGTSFIIRRCPEEVIGKKCNPNHGSCSNGNRYIPVQIVDVPGLIEGASEGKGMGNQFLQSITDASALMLVFDMEDAFKSNDVAVSIHKGINDIKDELIKWASSIIARDWERFAKKADSLNEKVEKQLSRKIGSLGLDEKHIHEIMSAGSLPQKLSLWSDDDFEREGEWNFIIIRYLNEKPMGFNELLKSVEGLNSKTLSRVLKNLQSAGIVERTIINTQPFLVQYSLTEKGRSLDPVFEALREWGARWAVAAMQVPGAR